MDMHGGRAICDGPGNYLQSAYQMVPGRHHGRGCQHPDAHADHLRARRAALASLPLPARSRPARTPTTSAGSTRSTRRSATTSHSRCRMPAAPSSTTSPADCSRRRRRRPSTRRDWYRQLGALLAQLCLRRRLTVAVARRRPEDQAEAVRAPRRRAVGALHAGLRAEALRGRRAPGERPHLRRVSRRRMGSIASRRRCAASSTTSPSRRRAG